MMRWDGRVMADAQHLPLADASVQCVVASPPYWGLRQYQIPDSIWGGRLDCLHDWQEIVKPSANGAHDAMHGSDQERSTRHPQNSNHCSRCGAWRGQLGLEPTPDLYVQHLVEIFRDIRRVLASNGTAWLNLGDCYATGAGKVGECPGGGDQGERWKGDSSRTRALRDGSHAGKHTAMAAMGPMTQPNRLPLPGLKPKDLVGVPWRVAFALQAEGWYLRSDIIWAKKNCMPESVLDRPTRSHEYIFLLSKSETYYYDAEAIREPSKYAGPNGTQHSPYAQGFGRRTREEEKARQDKQRGHSRKHAGFNDRWDQMTHEEQRSLGRNKRDVWWMGTQAFPDAHYAVFPEDIPETCILAGSRPGDVVLDPFVGSGTTARVAERLGRRWIGCDLGYQHLQAKRLRNVQKQLVMP